MGKLCRLTVEAFRGCDEGGYDQYDLLNGITYAESLLELGFTHEPLDDFDLLEYVKWARKKLLTR